MNYIRYLQLCLPLSEEIKASYARQAQEIQDRNKACEQRLRDEGSPEQIERAFGAAEEAEDEEEVGLRS